MQRMQRKFGKFLPREADDAQVSNVIHEFNEADNMLATLIEGSKAWRQAWTDILTRQLAITTEYELLYKPIEGATNETTQHVPVETPRDTLERIDVFKETMAELKSDMQNELDAMNSRLIVPATSAKDSIQVMKKTIKKREDRKLDYERYKGRAEKLSTKRNRSEREETALVKHEQDLARATEAYHVADQHLKAHLPGVVAAAYAILPHLLNNQIMIQNALLAHSYTAFINYAPSYGFSSDPEEEADIIRAWEVEFTPLRKETESAFEMLRQGKAIYTPMAQEDKSRGGSMTGLNIRNGIANRRKGSETSTKAPSPGASSAYNRPLASAPSIDQSTRPKIGSLPSNSLRPTTSRTSSNNGGVSPGQHDHLPIRKSSNPYFNDVKQSSAGASPALYPVSSRSSAVSAGSSYHSAQNASPALTPTALSSIAGAAAAVAKKKPPPPPPKPKRFPSQQAEYVFALYDFEGQNAGDLSFREGDRIKVIKKTDSVNDWWDGEVNGVQGAFPANYVQSA